MTGIMDESLGKTLREESPMSLRVKTMAQDPNEG